MHNKFFISVNYAKFTLSIYNTAALLTVYCRTVHMQEAQNQIVIGWV
jgi:hypothetical protein